LELGHEESISESVKWVSENIKRFKVVFDQTLTGRTRSYITMQIIIIALTGYPIRGISFPKPL
jgi:hypothetical protein